jgi:hypothetical protein
MLDAPVLTPRNDLTADDPFATCACCGQVKPLEAFSPDARKVNGRHSWCRDCIADAMRATRQRHKCRDLRTRFTIYGLQLQDD